MIIATVEDPGDGWIYLKDGEGNELQKVKKRKINWILYKWFKIVIIVN